MKRVVAPLLLLLVGLGSIAATFAIQDVVDGAGPVGDPFLSPRFSPNGDGRADEAVLSFRLARDARVRVLILADTRPGEDAPDEAVEVGDLPPLETVAVLLDEEREAGPVRVSWDGTTRDGELGMQRAYRAAIQLDGGGPVYLARGITRLDLAPPASCGTVSVDGDTLRADVVAEHRTRFWVQDGSAAGLDPDNAVQVTVLDRAVAELPPPSRVNGLRWQLEADIAGFTEPLLIVADPVDNVRVGFPPGPATPILDVPAADIPGALGLEPCT